MATYLQMTNRLLGRLREDTVADLSSLSSSDYGFLIAEIIADAVEEIKDTGPGWSVYDHVINVDISDGTREYDLTATVANSGNVDNSDTITNERSTLLFDPDGCAQVWAFDTSVDDTGYRMTYVDPNEMERVYQQDRDVDADDPCYFTLERTSSGVNSTPGWIMKIWPEPNASRRVRLKFNTPDDRLSSTTDESTVLKLPDRAIYLGALLLASNERGEEIGEPGGLLERRYINALSAGIESEIRVRERAGYYDWERN